MASVMGLFYIRYTKMKFFIIFLKDMNMNDNKNKQNLDIPCDSSTIRGEVTCDWPQVQDLDDVDDTTIESHKWRRRVSKRSGRSSRSNYIRLKNPKEFKESKKTITIESQISEKCIICYAEPNRWLNCKRKGLSCVNIKKYSESNNPICSKCCRKILNSRVKSCPLCRSTEWTKDLDIRYPKKKKSYANRKKKKRNKKIQRHLPPATHQLDLSSYGVDEVFQNVSSGADAARAVLQYRDRLFLINV